MCQYELPAWPCRNGAGGRWDANSHHDLDLVAVLHLEFLRRLRRLDALAVDEEADRIERLSLPLAVRLHQLLELRLALDLEEDFLAVLCAVLIICGEIGRSSAAYSSDNL